MKVEVGKYYEIKTPLQDIIIAKCVNIEDRDLGYFKIRRIVSSTIGEFPYREGTVRCWYIYRIIREIKGHELVLEMLR